MRRPCTIIYVHLVWSTWDRYPLIHPDWEAKLYAVMKAECRGTGSVPVAIGGTADHVHMLVDMPPTLTVADLVKQIKGASSHLVNHELSLARNFKWQGAYGAFSLGKSDVPLVVDYIARQKEHHRDNTLDPDLEWGADGD